jgi:hypothetical protein
MPAANARVPPFSVVVQFACALIFVFGDIGFDRPGRFGLAFDHLLILAAVYLVALLLGIASSIKTRRRTLVAVQVGLLVALGAGLTAPMLRTYEPVGPTVIERR